MKYVILLVGDGDERPWAEQAPEERDAVLARFEAFGHACREAAGVQILAGEALAEGDAATTVRHRGGERTVTDGPFAEAVEALGGFYLLEAPDLDVVLDLVRSLPAYDLQISPVVDPV